MKLTTSSKFVLLVAVVVVAGFAGPAEAGWVRRAWRWAKEHIRIRVSYSGTFSEKSACSSYYVDRADWINDPNAVQPSGSLQPPGSLPVVFAVRAAESATCNNAQSCVTLINNLRSDNLQAGYGDIRYAFIIAQDGQVYEGVGWDKVAVFDTFDNAPGNIGVAFAGTFVNGAPNQASLDAFKNLVECGINGGKIAPNPAIDVADGVLQAAINGIQW